MDVRERKGKWSRSQRFCSGLPDFAGDSDVEFRIIGAALLVTVVVTGPEVVHVHQQLRPVLDGDRVIEGPAVRVGVLELVVDVTAAEPARRTLLAVHPAVLFGEPELLA